MRQNKLTFASLLFLFSSAAVFLPASSCALEKGKGSKSHKTKAKKHKKKSSKPSKKTPAKKEKKAKEKADDGWNLLS